MRALRWLACAVAMAACVQVAARRAFADPISDGDQAVLHGKYDQAATLYGSVRGADQPKATLHLARLNLQRGQYVTAISGARIAGTADPSLDEESKEVMGEAQRLAGNLTDAKATLEDLVSRDPSQFRARYELGLVYRQTGQKDDEEAVWNAFFDDYNGGSIDKSNAEQLLYVAQAARYLEDWDDANDTFRDATKADPNLLEANVDWGQLFLERYAAPEARKCFDAVLATDPNNPDALAGEAEVEVDESYDVAKAQKLLSAALAGNPNQVQAVALKGRLLIDDQDWAGADAYLTPFITQDPELDWLAISAVARYFQDDTTGYAAREKQTLSIDPLDSSFYHTLADICVNEHRYPEALTFDGKALAINPKDWAALSGIGQSYLREGDQTDGYAYLQKAWKGDPYNVRTYNLLNLYDDIIPKKYVTFNAAPNFKLMTPKDEKDILSRYVPQQNEQEWTALVAKYGFTPDNPVEIDLFDDPSEYAVRTVGEPGLGALGVCFGKVITALSPSTGNLNWGMVLWHEEAHVFAIQLSKGRVPRWFTEGLSEYESRIERKEWHRTNDFDLYAGMKSGRMVGIAALNGTFTHARNMNDMTIAYHQSSLTLDFIARTYGFPKIVEALKMFGEGKQTPEVIQYISGLSTDDFDKAFRADLKTRLSVYDGQWYVHPMDYDDLDARKAAAAKSPSDSWPQGALAVALLESGDVKGASAQADKTLAMEPNQKEALFVKGVIAMDLNKDYATAKTDFNHILSLGANGYELHERLCEMAADGGDVATSESECAQAKKLDPEREDPYLTLAALYAKVGRTDDEEAQLEPAAYDDPMTWDTYSKLIALNTTAKRWGKVREFGEMGLRINPFDPDLHYDLGQAYVDAKRWDDAIYEEQSALLCTPKDKGAVEVTLAQAYLGKGDKADAKHTADQAIADDPSSADAKSLEASLK
jgi:Tfp pilus assembly protein PilF